MATGRRRRERPYLAGVPPEQGLHNSVHAAQQDAALRVSKTLHATSYDAVSLKK